MPRYVDIERARRLLEEMTDAVEARKKELAEAESRYERLKAALEVIEAIAEERPGPTRVAAPTVRGGQPMQTSEPIRERHLEFPEDADAPSKLRFLIRSVGHFATGAELQAELNKHQHSESKHFVPTTMSVHSRGEAPAFVRARVESRGRRLFVGLPEWVREGEAGELRLVSQEYAPRTRSGRPASASQISLQYGGDDKEK